ncbi:hypothetical protein ACFRU3_09230 [Streptomyces sp. NPDC056910]|uniref:hypothetical protein n=1 Tax=Streptomyces sp. NPDC056910 TaxID=3345964 RepID=UPI0036A48E9B
MAASSRCAGSTRAVSARSPTAWTGGSAAAVAIKLIREEAGPQLVPELVSG